MGARGKMSAVSKAKLHLTLPEHLASEPIVQRVGSEFGLVTNIHRANLGERGGWIILEAEGEDERLTDAIAWLMERGLQVDRLED